MGKLKKLARVGFVLALIGCGRTTEYNIGKKADDIAREAERHKGDTDWAYDVSKSPNDPRISRYTFLAGKPKCNLFVCDMLYDGGVRPPLTSDGRWPITASMWTGSVAGWNKVSFQQRGDVVSNGTHCGIAVDCSYTIAAGTNRVYQNNDIRGGTIQRYNE